MSDDLPLLAYRPAAYAVMAQRHSADIPEELDYFPTQPWGGRALLAHVLPLLHGGRGLAQKSVWEPACGEGYLSIALREQFGSVQESDVHDYGTGHEVKDFLTATVDVAPDWIITNPPFRLATSFVLHACSVARVGVALLMRSTFTEGKGRWGDVYSHRAPRLIAHFVERLPLVKGRVDQRATTATAYSWFVWTAPFGRRRSMSPTVWIPPCRKMLERADDYRAGGGLL
jgi:hypothetical protein